MSEISTCSNCSAAVAAREGKVPKFCTRCGERIVLTNVVPERRVEPSLQSPHQRNGVPLPQPSSVTRSTPVQQSVVGQASNGINRPTQAFVTHSVNTPISATSRAEETKSRSKTPYQTDQIVSVPPPHSTDISQSDEFPKGWNWGAFLLPGVWMIAHRLRWSIVGIVCLGVPFLIALLALSVNIAQWKGNSSLDGGFFALEHATVSILWVLGIYVVACLCSIRVAQQGSANAFQNFDSETKDQFKSRQRNWSVGGILFALMLCLSAIILVSIYQKAYKDVNTIPSASLVQHPEPPVTWQPTPEQIELNKKITEETLGIWTVEVPPTNQYYGHKHYFKFEKRKCIEMLDGHVLHTCNWIASTDSLSIYDDIGHDGIGHNFMFSSDKHRLIKDTAVLNNFDFHLQGMILQKQTGR